MKIFEVYLSAKDVKIFKAKFSYCPPGITAYHKVVDDKCGRFLIIKTLRDANKWSPFDVDVHLPGAFIFNDVLIPKFCPIPI